MDEKIYEHPDLGLQTLREGVSTDTVEDYFFIGLMVVTLVPLLVIMFPIWAPIMLIGWLSVKIWKRYGG